MDNKEHVIGVWRNIQKRKDLGDRVSCKLECGHTAVLHKNVAQYNGRFYNSKQTSVFCTRCELFGLDIDFSH